MNELSLDKAKEIITEPSPIEMDGRSRSMLNFTSMLREAEVYTFSEIEQIKNASHDLVHLSGVHKFRYNMPSMKCEDLRVHWTRWWGNDDLLKAVPWLKRFIIDTCEASAYGAGKSRRAYGLFLGCSGFDNGESGILRRPWRTPEWIEEHRIKRPVFVPLTEFYPFITAQPTEDHEFLLAVEALVPKSLPKHIRGDICQDMIVAILTGDATLENIRDAVPRYIKWFLKKEPSRYGDLSLDTPMRGSNYGGGTNIKTLGESIAAEFA